MTIQSERARQSERTTEPDTERAVPPEPTVRPDPTDEPIEVHRNAGLLLLVAFGSLAMAAAYGWRASQGAAGVLWFVVAALVVIGALHLAAWIDARTPVLVADEHGVRLRAGREWQGLTWSAIARVELHPRRGFLRDGRIVVVPEEDGDDLSLPMGLATAARAEEVVRRLTGLARDRTTVTVRVSPKTDGREPAPSGFDRLGDDALAPGWVPASERDHAAIQPVTDADPDAQADAGDEAADDGVDAGVESEVDSDVAADADDAEAGEQAEDTAPQADAESGDRTESDHPTGPVSVPGPAGPPTDLGPAWEDIPARPASAVPAIRGSGRAVRADITRSDPSSVGMLALKRQVDELPEARELRGTDGRVGLVIESTPVVEEDDDEPVLDVSEEPEPEWSGEPESDPLIGPTLREARERLQLSVDTLAERTRIRPHVIESIETDDFAPCGGDFYARGHLRSLARVLGVDAGDLIRTYDAAYAQAPIEARRVFEAELATGPKPSIRLTTGGPNWAALIAVVLVLVIIWGAAQYLTGGTDDTDAGAEPAGAQVPAPQDDSKQREDLKPFGPPTENRLVLAGRGSGSRVVVRTEDGSKVWRGKLAKGQRKRLEVPGKATVEALGSGPAMEARVNGDKPELVGGQRGDRKAVLGKS